MQKPPKEKSPPADPDDLNDESEKTWAEDQKKRVYYYDDSHGYEIYNPDEEESEAD